jgi:DME family drug/metabolite transporter
VRHLIGELAALCAAITWTFSSVIYAKALSVASPFQANLIRFTSISAILVALVAAVGKLEVLISLPVFLSVIAALCGIIGLVLGDTLYLFALRAVGVARAVPICSIYPLFNVLIAFLLMGERITLEVGFGAFSIVTGTWLISYRSSDWNTKLSKTIRRKGFAMALSAAVIWSISIVLLDFTVTSPGVIGADGILAVTFIRVLAAWIALLVLSPVFDKKFRFARVPWRTWLIIASGGLIGLGGQFLFSLSFLYTQEARAVPLASTTPFFSVVAGAAMLDEPVTREIVAGSLTIVLGTLLLFL